MHALLKGLRLFGREPAKAWLMTRMALWIVILSALVKIVPLPRALELTSRKPRRLSRESNYENELAAAIDAVLGLNFLVFKSSCWKRTTVLHRYLAQRGVATTIVFGVKKESAGELKGHAWLECQGKPILEAEPPDYIVTYRFPTTERLDGELNSPTELHGWETIA